MEGRIYDERRFEERKREAKDKHVESWVREMKRTSWNRKARYYRNEINR